MQTFYTGGYTGSEETASKGIYQFDFNPETREMGNLSLVVETTNPSWLMQENKNTYAVGETPQGVLNVYEGGELKQTLASEGASPCHLALSKDKQHLVVANYMGGNIALFSRDRNTGLLGEQPQVKQHTGAGPDKDRQEAAHAHWVGWDKAEKILYVVDLGIDTIMAYPFDQASGQLGEGFVALKAKPGAGPRHMIFHPTKNAIYVVNELDNTLSLVVQNDDGTLTEKQTISILPEDFNEYSLAAHIVLNAAGSRLYVSNRGHDSIAVVALEEEGTMDLIQWQSSLGHWPRYFSLLEDSNTLLVANEQSNMLVALEVAADGRLAPTGQTLDVGTPTFIGTP
ncbi:lactonase family protein [Teredinibacter haidensis]|uniref:lactonase family protein n=1 Tax=Teredinibacter haidensis TaxID=2731755 RepID=UPI0015880DF7|nr:lactonase family protein [Teredinibacter haidensis]